MEPSPAEQLHRWAQGPVRWLMLPEERRAMARVETAAQAVAFRAAFWARRDEKGRSSGPGSFRARFLARVADADRLYGGERRGSLTDRGRALVLLGPPGAITMASRAAISLSPEPRPGRRAIETVPVELWGWRPEQFPESLLERLDRTVRVRGAEVRFELRRGEAALVEGEDLLQAAAEAAVVGPLPGE